jgi:hypothetical protein
MEEPKYCIGQNEPQQHQLDGQQMFHQTFADNKRGTPDCHTKKGQQVARKKLLFHTYISVCLLERFGFRCIIGEELEAGIQIDVMRNRNNRTAQHLFFLRGSNAHIGHRIFQTETAAVADFWKSI